MNACMDELKTLLNQPNEMYEKLSAPTANGITVRPHAPNIILQNPTRLTVTFYGLSQARYCELGCICICSYLWTRQQFCRWFRTCTRAFPRGMTSWRPCLPRGRWALGPGDSSTSWRTQWRPGTARFVCTWCLLASSRFDLSPETVSMGVSKICFKLHTHCWKIGLSCTNLV